jgi:hypothetical protein
LETFVCGLKLGKENKTRKIGRCLFEQSLAVELANIDLRQSKPGTDVMITIFCDFAYFRRKKWCLSQKPML